MTTAIETAGRPEPFASYAVKPGEGRNSLPRIVIGSIVIVVVAGLGTLAVLAGGAMLSGFGLWPAPFGAAPASADVFGDFMRSRAGMLAAFLSLGAIWPAVWLAMRLVHRRYVSGLFGTGNRLDWPAFRRGFAAMAIVAGIGTLVGLFLDPTVARTTMPVAAWFAVLPLALVILLIQTSAEELLFRGYLLQSLAHRFASPLVWALIPLAIFAVLHWQPGALGWINAMVIGSIAVFAAASSYLVWRTGNLGASMGMHFANNILALLAVSSEDPSNALALYAGRPLTDPGWTIGEVAGLAIVQLLMIAAAVLLLTWRGSPLRLSLSDPEPRDRAGTTGAA